jgi:hypothetical protein
LHIFIGAGSALGITTAIALFGFLFTYTALKKDPLLIVYECVLTWQVGIVLVDIPLVLLIVDPNQLQANGVLKWRTFVAPVLLAVVFIQTVLQVGFVHRYIHKKVKY